MGILSKQAFETARSFLRTRARRLDQAVFEYRFEGGSASAVLDALGEYQNPDGGFGRALEPDLRTPSFIGLGYGHCPGDHGGSQMPPRGASSRSCY